VANYFGGLIVIAAGWFSPKEVVRVLLSGRREISGRVEHIGLLYTKLINRAGKVAYIPNSAMVAHKVRGDPYFDRTRFSVPSPFVSCFFALPPHLLSFKWSRPPALYRLMENPHRREKASYGLFHFRKSPYGSLYGFLPSADIGQVVYSLPTARSNVIRRLACVMELGFRALGLGPRV
jgi:hypothetical protein